MSIISQSRLELYPYFNPEEALRLKQLDKKWVRSFWIFLFIALLFHAIFFVGDLIRRLNIIDTTPPPLSIEIVAPRGSAPDAGEEKKLEDPKPEPKEKEAPKPTPSPKPSDLNKPVEKVPPTSQKEEKPEAPKKEEVPKPEEKAPKPEEKAPRPEEKAPTPSIPEKSVDKSAPTVDADKYADYLKNPKPAYPMGPYREGVEGTVWLRVQVLEDGTVGSVELAQTSGNDELDQSALTTVKKWRFKAAIQGGVAAAQFIRIPITFKLNR